MRVIFFALIVSLLVACTSQPRVELVTAMPPGVTAPAPPPCPAGYHVVSPQGTDWSQIVIVPDMLIDSGTETITFQSVTYQTPLELVVEIADDGTNQQFVASDDLAHTGIELQIYRLSFSPGEGMITTATVCRRNTTF